MLDTEPLSAVDDPAPRCLKGRGAPPPEEARSSLELFAADSALIGIQDLRLQTRLFKQRINRDTFGIGVANILPQSGDGSSRVRQIEA